ncbi:MAG: glucose-1-phosphate cytidylyltransferase [Verrucomicrobiota bacterium]
MKAVILAGGLGTRLSEETHLKPKPMVEIGGKPILWHILKIYSHHGIRDFIICAGYKGYVIKEFFANYFLHTSDVTFHLGENRVEIVEKRSEPWTVTIIDTGEETNTGGRLRRVAHLLDEEEPFCFTYGDGVGDIDLGKLIDFHRSSGKKATLTAVQPPGRYGALDLAEDGAVKRFREKPDGDNAWINGGFFVLQPSVVEYVESDATSWERDPLERLSNEEQLSAFRHHGFWRPMDTLRDKQYLEALWQEGKAPWRVW